MEELLEHVRTVTAKGQVTIPAEVRKLLGVGPHDKVVFRITDAGTVELKPAEMTLEDTFGAVTPRRKAEDFEDVKSAAIEEQVDRTLEKMRD